MTTNTTCPHVTVREPEPTGQRRYQDRCVKCDAVLGYACAGAHEPCLTAWELETATQPMPAEDVATITASVTGRRAA